MNKLKTMMFAAGVAMMGAMSASALELVTNGGFEEGPYPGTFVWGVPNSWSGGSCGIQNKADGTWCVATPYGTYANFRGVGGWIAQSLDFPVAGTYQLSFAYASRSGADYTGKVSDIKIGDKVIKTYTSTETSWVTMTVDFAVTAPGPQTLSFVSTNSKGDSCLDAVSVTLLTPAETVTDCSSWRQVKAVLEAGYNARLIKDVVATDQIGLRASQKVTVDLNGHKITASSRVFDIVTSAKLTLIDSAGGGVIDGQNLERAYSGACVKVCSGCEFVFEGGTIQNFKTSGTACGVGICNEGTVTMNGGTITNCVSSEYGGGIWNSGTVNLNGGTIVGCTSADYGGAVYNYAGTTTIKGGTIANCTGTGAGGGIYMYGGAAYIYGGSFTGNHTGGWGGFGAGAVNIYIYGGYFADNTADKACPFIDGDGTTLIGQLYGGVWKGANPLTGNDCTCASGAVYAYGDNYVIGKNIAMDTDKTVLTGGLLTFNPTNELYTAAGLKVADYATATGSDTSWTLKATNAVEVGDWATLRDNLFAGNSVTVTNDIAITEQNQSLYVVDAIARDVTLDLNGHTIDAYNGTADAGEKDRLFALASTVKSTLTITDSVGGGALVGHKIVNNHNGAVAYVGHNCSIIVNGGTIRGFSTTGDGGAFHLADTSTLELNGGTIEGCYATVNGGAVNAVAGTTFTMNGGTISNCTAATAAGAIYNAGTTRIYGGTIDHCQTTSSGNGGAIFAYTDSTTEIYGGTFTNNSVPENRWGGFCYAWTIVKIYGGYFAGNTAATADHCNLIHGAGYNVYGYIYGGVFNNYDPDPKGATSGDNRCHILQDSATATKVGDNYVVGKNIRADGTALTGGQYTFALTNAEYSATGLYDAAKASARGAGTAWHMKSSVPVNPTTWDELKSALVQGCDVTLTRNIQETASLQAIFYNNQQVTVDLNGYTLTQYSAYWLFDLRSANCKLTIKDSATGGKIVGSGSTVNDNGGCLNISSGEFVLDGGTISGFTAQKSGAIYNAGTMTMNGGTIKNSVALTCGGAVYNDGTFTMNGGVIENCTAQGQSAGSCGGGAVYNTGAFTMNGGELRGNTGYWGGGVGTIGTSSIFTLNDGKIVNNTATLGYGAAVCQSASGEFVMNGGEISGNTSANTSYGGAVTVDTKFTMNGGTIGANYTRAIGLDAYGAVVINGGVFVGNGANNICKRGESALTINGAVSDNSIIGTYKASDKSCTQVGTKYIVGKSVLADSANQLVSGEYTFCPTNAEYAAASLAVDTVNSTLEGADQSWTLTPNAAISAGDWATVKAALEAGVSVKLAKNISITTKNHGFYVVDAIARDITIDLNGYTVDAYNGSETAGEKDRLFTLASTVKSTLTIIDSAGGGAFIGHKTVSGGHNGAFAYVGNNCSIIVNGGTIRGFSTANLGGAVHLANTASMELNGGTIEGCSAAERGGAVSVEAAGTFTMNGGTITGCSVDYNSADNYFYGGGAIYNSNAGAVTINGGTLENNSVKHLACGGVFFNFGTVTMNGGVIKNNSSAHCGSVHYSNANYYSGKFIINGGEIVSNSGKYQTFEGLIHVRGGYIHNNTNTSQGPYQVYEGTYFSGGVFGSYEQPPAAKISSGYECKQVGSNYVVGKGVFVSGSTLNEGFYTFCATNAEYVAAGVDVAETPVAQGTNPETWTIAAKQYCVCGDKDCEGEGEGHGIRTWYAWTSTTALPTIAGDWYLANDVTLTAQYSPVTGVAIDLAGHTIRQTTSGTTSRVFNIGANVTLTLTDSVGGGKVTGANLTGDNHGGAVYLPSAGGTFIMYGGSLCGNKAVNGAGIYTYQATSVKIYGGVIEDNTASCYGGGICLGGNGTHIIRNCVIRNNKAIGNEGGGVRLDAGTFSVIDCVITNNEANAHGGLSHGAGYSSTISLGGATVIRDNHVTGQTAQNNLFVDSGYAYTVSTTEPLTDGAEIGATAAAGAAIVTTPSDADYTQYFCADSDAYTIVNDANQVKLVTADSAVAKIGDTQYSSLQYAFNSAEEGETVTLVKNTTEKVTVESAKDVIFDLNGLILTASGRAFEVYENAKLTLVDSVGGGKITGATSSAVYVYEGGTFVLESGEISNCSSSTHGGAIYNAGTFTMNGGEIANCTASSGSSYCHGGGVYCDAGVFTMNGGAIRNCGAYNIGGGVSIVNGSTYTLNGGEITGCTLTKDGWGTAINVQAGSTLEMHGGTITNNPDSFSTGGTIQIDGTMNMYGGTVCGTGGTGTVNDGSGQFYGGYIGGVFNMSSATVYGLVGDDLSVGTKKAAGTSCTLVGSNYVVGQSIAQENSQLTGGTYTFCPTNAEYVAGGLAVAPWVDMTKDETADPKTWTLADGTTPIVAGDTAKARVKDGVCWITGTGVTSDKKPLTSQWESVKEVRISDGVTGVGTYFFDEFYYLTNVTVAASCTSLGKGAFYRCFSLEQITFEGAMPEGSANAIVITAGIKLVDDEPVVYAVPNVTVNGKAMTLKGSNDLKNWEDVASGNEKNYHFFKFVAE